MKIVKLKDVAKVTTGKTPSTADRANFGGSIPFVKPPDLGTSNPIISTKELLTDQGAHATTVIPKNSIMVCCIGSLGKVGIAGRDLATNQQINSLTFAPNLVEYKYGYYFALIFGRKLLAMANSAVVPIVNKTAFSNIDFPLISLKEQKRIVRKLDAADALRQKRKQAIALLDDYLKAVFLEMFGDPHNNIHKFPVGTIGDLVSEVKYGTSKKSDENGEYPYLRMNNITYSGELYLSDLKYIYLTEHDKEKYLAKYGDVLFNRTNSKELVGKTAVFHLNEPMAIAGYLIRVRVNDKAVPEYISGYLNSKHGKLTLENMCKNIVGMANINAKELQKICIIIPNIDLQKRYADFVKKIRTLKTKMIAQSDEMDINFSALMQFFFNSSN